MAWKVEFLESAGRSLAKLDREDQRRILKFVRERLEGDDNPRRIGKPMQGNHAGRWRYRVGDYRLVCNIEDGKLLVLVLAVGHRSGVYR
ncbi:MAG: type II toxin-antitoxin system RelE/ParE family toxin [Candidatus Methylumidiphilus sp.]